MERDEWQGRQLIQLGWADSGVVQRAWTDPRRGPTTDLCAVLVLQGLLPAERAEAVRRSAGSSGPEAAAAGGARPDTRRDSDGQARPSDAAPVPVEGRVGSTILGTELGRGGMGVVYRGRQPGLEREVAVKILKVDGSRSEALERFEIEARAMARLQHPNILRVLDVGRDADRAWMVTELAAGGSLEDRLKAEQQLSVDEAVGITEQLARGLHHAHSHSIVHRDMKPANVLIDAEGVPLIADFGLAKALDEDIGLSKSGQLLGTVPYMPPEQLEGVHSRIDGRSDIYAVGVTLFEMLSGRLPFEAATVETLMVKVLMAEPPRIASLRRDIPRDLETLLARCLAKDPNDRYATALELAEDCRRVCAGEPIQARPIGPRERLRLWCRRHPVAAALGLAALLVIPVGGFVFKTREARLRARGEREARRRFEQVRRLANAMIFDIHDAVDDLPGSTRARRLMVEKGLEYLDALEADADAAPELTLDLGRGYVRVGDVLGGASGRNLGDVEGAKVAYEKGRSLLSELVKRPDAAPRAVLELARAEHHIADLRLSRGAREEAARLYEAALARLDRLAAGSGAEALESELRLLQANLRHSMGRLASDDGRLLEGRKLLLMAEASLGQLAKRSPEPPVEVLMARFAVLGDLSRVAEKRLEITEAIARLEAALPLGEQVVRRRPEGTTGRRNLAVVLGNLASLRRRQGLAGPSIEAYRRSVAMLSALSQLDPTEVTLRYTHAAMLMNLASQLATTGQTDEAATLFKEARGIVTELLKGDAAHRKWRGLRAKLDHQCGGLALSLGRLKEARSRFADAVRGFRELGGGAELRQSLAEVLRDYSVALSRDGDHAAALEALQEARDSLETLLREAPSKDLRIALAETLRNIGYAERGAGRAERALEHFGAAVRIYDELAETDELAVEAKREAAGTHEAIAGVHRSAGRLEAALRELGVARSALEALAEAAPEDTQIGRELAVTRCSLGNVEVARGRPDEAIGWYDKARVWFSARLKERPKDVVLRRQLIVLLGNVANAHRVAGRARECREAGRACLAMAEALSEMAPESLDARRLLADSLRDLGFANQLCKEPEPALGLYRRSLAVFEDLLERKPEDFLARRSYGNVLGNLAQIEQREGKLEPALKHWTKALAIFDELLKGDPEDVVARQGRAVMLYGRARCLEVLGRRTEALECYRGSLEVLAALPSSIRAGPDLKAVEMLSREAVRRLGGS